MKLSIRLMVLVAVLLLDGCAPKANIECGCSANDILPYKCGQKGFVKSGNMVQPDPSVSLAQKAEKVNNGQYKVVYKKLKKDDVVLLDDIPIGAIIPHWGNWEFSDRWQICMGQIINDTESPLYGKRVPDLTGKQKPTYIAGTLEEEYFNKRFGKNYIPKEKAHMHKGKVAQNKSIVYPDKNTIRKATATAGPYHKHDISIKKAGAHDHGGDNKPYSFGLVYLIKVK
jgi:hypothetical protein